MLDPSGGPAPNPGGGTYETNIPGLPGYAGTALAAKRAYQQALARLNSRRSGTLRQFGYAGDIDPTTGVLRNMRVDPNNQYGMYQEMLGAHNDQGEMAEEAAQSRGLRGGLAKQMMSRQRHDFGRDAMQLGTQLTGSLTGYQDEQNQAGYARDSALWEAQQQAARDAIAARNFSPADFSDLEYPAYGDEPVDPTQPPPEEPLGPGEVPEDLKKLMPGPKAKAKAKAKTKAKAKASPFQYRPTESRQPYRPPKKKPAKRTAGGK